MDDLDLLIHEDCLESAHRLFLNVVTRLPKKSTGPGEKVWRRAQLLKDGVLVDFTGTWAPDFPLLTDDIFDRAKK